MNTKENKNTTTVTRKVTEFTVSEEIGTVLKTDRGFSKELNVVAWSDKPPIFDLRAWRESESDGTKYPLRGITFRKDELIALRDILNKIDFENTEVQ